jgi:hypothetical protein
MVDPGIPGQNTDAVENDRTLSRVLEGRLLAPADQPVEFHNHARDRGTDEARAPEFSRSSLRIPMFASRMAARIKADLHEVHVK